MKDVKSETPHIKTKDNILKLKYLIFRCLLFHILTSEIKIFYRFSFRNRHEIFARQRINILNAEIAFRN